MQRWISIVLGLGALVLAAVLVSKGFTPPKPVGPVHDAAAEAGGEAGLAATLDAGPATDAGADDASPLLPDPNEIPTGDGGGVGSKMPDGTPVPPLPAGTPAVVRFGVILVQYQGAQAARPDARSRAAAKELADKLAEDAKKDFSATVKKGDPGSQDDVGHLKRGILEPASEYFLFSLEKGGVSAPFDTPRGFWIVKRID